MLKKYLLVILLTAVVVGGIVIKTSPTFYEYSTPVNPSKASYKEEFTNDTELSMPNNDISKDTQLNSTLETEDSISNITKNIQTSATSKIENSSSKISENVQTDIISKPDNLNNTENKVSSTNNDNSTIEPKNTAAKANENASTNSTFEINLPTIYYDRTTSIYDDDEVTLLRVEYYLNNKLTYYSYVEQFDATTNSYTEKICQWDYEKDTETLVRTNIYSNGRLINSY